MRDVFNIHNITESSGTLERYSLMVRLSASPDSIKSNIDTCLWPAFNARTNSIDVWAFKSLTRHEATASVTQVVRSTPRTGFPNLSASTLP
jgi:hypothetical protein